MALVAIVGRPNVGKSTLFNRLTEERRAIVDDQPGVTRDRLFGEVEWTGRTFDLVDTGGLVPRSAERFDAAIREQVMLTLEEADVILFVVDTETGHLRPRRRGGRAPAPRRAARARRRQQVRQRGAASSTRPSSGRSGSSRCSP